MNRIDEKFSHIAEHKDTALIPYIAAGDPDIEWTAEMMHALVTSGADMIELGLAFSDPMADGPTIQHAYERIVERGISVDDVLNQVRIFRKTNTHTPIILMGYLNSIEVKGYEAFCKQASDAGIDGLLIVDAPPEESDQLQKAMQSFGMQQIFLIAPTTTEARIDIISAAASGFIYYVSMKGVTGSAAVDSQDVATHVNKLKQKTGLPVAVGFGITDAQSARAVAQSADAVVIGSALVSRVAKCNTQNEAVQTIEEFLVPISEAL